MEEELWKITQFPQFMNKKNRLLKTNTLDSINNRIQWQQKQYLMLFHKQQPKTHREENQFQCKLKSIDTKIMPWIPITIIRMNVSYKQNCIWWRNFEVFSMHYFFSPEIALSMLFFCFFVLFCCIYSFRFCYTLYSEQIFIFISNKNMTLFHVNFFFLSTLKMIQILNAARRCLVYFPQWNF